MTYFRTTWTDEQNEALRYLWSKGWTGSQIGDELGFSRCAILGRARRLNLPARGHTSGMARSTKSRLAEMSAHGGAAHKAKAKQQPRPAPAPKPELVEPPAKRTTKIVATEVSTLHLSLRQAVRHQTKTTYAIEISGDPATVGRPLIGAPRSWCRWPIDGDGIALCCAASTSGDGSWCPAHRRIVYASPAERRAAE